MAGAAALYGGNRLRRKSLLREAGPLLRVGLCIVAEQLFIRAGFIIYFSEYKYSFFLSFFQAPKGKKKKKDTSIYLSTYDEIGKLVEQISSGESLAGAVSLSIVISSCSATNERTSTTI